MKKISARPVSKRSSRKQAATSSRAYAAGILQLEAEAITNVIKHLDSSFDRAVEMILHLPEQGRVVVSGMGKAGFVAMKISATFASTGVPSYFLHPAEAIHGDLGRYTKNDLALLLSNSGETVETVGILPHVRRIGCPVIAITGEPESPLAQHSDLVLSIGRIKEAGPLGLAPTTSTTAMLALGDALAMAVLKRQNFSKEQFALFHPGGNLGRRLMLVSEVMRRDEENCVVPDSMPTREVLHRITITKGRPGAASIVDGRGMLAGVFTDGNLRRLLEQGDAFLELPIKKVMTPNPKTIAPDQIVQEALRVMSEFKIDQLIVLDAQRKPVGMLDIQDLVDIKLR